MNQEDYKGYLNFARGVALNAGEIMKKYFRSDASFKIKPDETLVTVADEEINSMVIKEVKLKYPEHSVDGEEESYLNGSKFVWVCDPLDGTALFKADIPMSVFSLALVIDGTPVVGCVYDPWQERIYTATKGGGAFMNDTLIRVSDKGMGAKNLASYDWWSNADYDIGAVVYELVKKHNLYFISVGSTTHAAMLVASGKLCVSIFPGTKGKNVDIAAAKVIVEEAGGKVTNMLGQDQRYDQSIKGAVVSNGIDHEKYIEIIETKLNL